MPKRLYICGLYGSGTRADPYRSAFDQVFQGQDIRRYQVIDGVDAMYALVVADLDTSQHTQFTNDVKVRHITKALATSELQSLTQGQRNAIQEVLTFLGQSRANSIFTGQALVIDVIRWLIGNRRWDGLTNWDE